jgi:hypothetical protein
MAFKRSGVRLPLAPPAFAPFGGYGSASQPPHGGGIKGKKGGEGCRAEARRAKADRLPTMTDVSILEDEPTPGAPLSDTSARQGGACA